MANWHSCLLSIFTLLFILFIYYFFFNDLLYHRYILYWFVIIFKYYYRFLFFLIFNHLYLFIFMLLNYFFDFVMYTWYYVLLFHSLGVYVNLLRSLTKNLSIRFEILENSNLFTSPCWILRIYSTHNLLHRWKHRKTIDFIAQINSIFMNTSIRTLCIKLLHLRSS